MRRALLVLLAALTAACSSAPSHPNLPPEAQRAMRALEDHAAEWNPDAFIVARGPAVLIDKRTRAGRKPIHLRSLTKLFTATAVGLLADEGKVSLDEKLARLLPGYGEGLKAKVTLRELLAHSSGLQTFEGDPYVPGNPDVLATVLDFPVEREPGTRAAYDNGGYILAAAAAAKAAGEPIDDYLSRKLFAPLGILAGDFTWWRDKAGTRYGHAGLVMTADGLLSFGRFWLDGGTRDGKRLLSESSVDAATSSQNKADPAFGLGWLLLGRDQRGRPPWDGYWMNGTDGQMLFVHPASGVVCVQLVERSVPGTDQRAIVAGALEPCRALAHALTRR